MLLLLLQQHLLLLMKSCGQSFSVRFPTQGSAVSNSQISSFQLDAVSVPNSTPKKFPTRNLSFQLRFHPPCGHGHNLGVPSWCVIVNLNDYMDDAGLNVKAYNHACAMAVPGP